MLRLRAAARIPPSGQTDLRIRWTLKIDSGECIWEDGMQQRYHRGVSRQYSSRVQAALRGDFIILPNGATT